MRKTYMIVVIVILTVCKGFQLSAYGGSAITAQPSDAGFMYTQRVNLKALCSSPYTAMVSDSVHSFSQHP